MPTRFSGWGTEQRGIQVQYMVEQAKKAVDELAERLQSLHSLGKFTDNENKLFKKSLDSIKKSLEKPSKKKG
jgi:hypothetical protein